MSVEVAVRQLKMGDLTSARDILEVWMRDEPDGAVRIDNVESALAAMTSSIDVASPTYFVAEQFNIVLGVAGLVSEGIDPELIDGSQNPVEAVNVYVADSSRGKGIGTMLMNEIEQMPNFKATISSSSSAAHGTEDTATRSGMPATATGFEAMLTTSVLTPNASSGESGSCE